MLLSNTQEIANVANGSLSVDRKIYFEGVSTDTRSDVEGKLFVALEGAHFDGHDFIKVAEDNGAKAIISHKDINSNLPLIKVVDTEKAYQKIAAFHRKSYGPIVIAITGSNGKTSTKNMLNSILQLEAPTLSTEGNFNNHLGVPKTLLNLKKNHQFCIIEMGANHQNEISLLCNIANPNLAIITNANNAHLGEFGNLKNLVEAKGEIFESLSKDGIAFINNESPHKKIWRKISGTQEIIFFGNQSTIYASNIQQSTEDINFQLNIGENKINITLKLIGRHQVDNALAAAACASELGIGLEIIKDGLENTIPEKGRLELIELENFTLLNDSYNANPHSMKAAIDTIKKFPGKKIAVLGSMDELGKDSIKLHQEIGEYAKNSGIEKLYSIGKDAKHYQGDHFQDVESIVNILSKKHQKSVILVKGSRMMELNKLVDILVNSQNSP
jgi:UDP-N-acetylmuramoyl-tripeptide--D-alanyl-D-alanine ligase